MFGKITPSLKEKAKAKGLDKYLKAGAGVNRRTRRYHARTLIKAEPEKPREKVELVFTETKKAVPEKKVPQSLLSKIKTIFRKMK